MACVVDIARAAVARGKPVALATSGLRDHVEAHLARTNSAVAAKLLGEWESALRLLDEMEQRSLQPNVISFNAALSALEKARQWEQAVQLLDEASAAGVRLSQETLVEVLCACAATRAAPRRASPSSASSPYSSLSSSNLS